MNIDKVDLLTKEQCDERVAEADNRLADIKEEEKDNKKKWDFSGVSFKIKILCSALVAQGTERVASNY